MNQILSVPTNQGNIAVWDTQNEGIPVVFVHGNSACKEYFHRQMKMLENHTGKNGQKYRFVAIDLIGHGDSAKANNPRDAYTYIGYATIIAEVVAKLTLKQPILVGWSLGGHAVIETVNKDNASCFIPDVRGVVLTGTPPISLESPQTRMKGFLNNEKIRSLISQETFNEEQARQFVALGGVDPNENPKYVEAALKVDAGARKRVQEWKTEDEARKVNQPKTVAESQIPFCVVAGTDDLGINTKHIEEIPWGNLWQRKVHMLQSGHATFIHPGFNTILQQFLDDFS